MVGRERKARAILCFPLSTFEGIERSEHEEARQDESIEGSFKKEERQEFIKKVERRKKVSHIIEDAVRLAL